MFLACNPLFLKIMVLLYSWQMEIYLAWEIQDWTDLEHILQFDVKCGSIPLNRF